jgi:hypothetical protein
LCMMSGETGSKKSLEKSAETLVGIDFALLS